MHRKNRHGYLLYVAPGFRLLNNEFSRIIKTEGNDQSCSLVGAVHTLRAAHNHDQAEVRAFVEMSDEQPPAFAIPIDSIEDHEWPDKWMLSCKVLMRMLKLQVAWVYGGAIEIRGGRRVRRVKVPSPPSNPDQHEHCVASPTCASLLCALSSS